MGFTSIWHWLIVLLIILLLFGRGKIPSLMGDMAKGIKAFKTGMKEEPEAENPRKQIDEDSTAQSTKEATVKKDEAAHG